ncbi:hypothetical protein [Saccharophagus degradans]|uniref:Uncharacterized protein n=1 Tax=Saccharophagus degradans TaxID=86304 RepID=A0AAW7X9H7_9GAMM|nr:hypothetical protein [Saccharophagus degradans]MDO6423920.1 hypothetical protein [Saccharophagus degradans]MDO6607997.1 hypothetical protein [Saccharophagus degradans]
MLRLKKNALTEKAGKLFYKNELFSGIAFTISQGEIVKAIKISEGMEIGQYSPKYLPGYDCRIIDIEILDPEDESDYEPFLCLNGVRFNGIALEFDGDFCTGELLFVRGWSDSQVTYYKTGCLESIELIEDGFSQIYQWHENEQLKKYEVTSRNSFSFNLAFNEDGYLSALGMEGDYFNQVKLISDKLAIPAFKNEHFIDELKASEFLSISGNSVTDRLFKRLISSGALQQTDYISLFDTSVTKESLHLLQANTRLNKLFINSNTIKLEDVKIFKSDKPDCHIELNREEVLA